MATPWGVDEGREPLRSPFKRFAPLHLAHAPHTLRDALWPIVRERFVINVDDDDVKYRHVLPIRPIGREAPIWTFVFKQHEMTVILAQTYDKDLTALLAAAGSVDHRLRTGKKSMHAWILWIVKGGNARVEDWLTTPHVYEALKEMGYAPSRWLLVKRALRARAVIMYWLKLTEHLYAEGGVGRKRDREAFEAGGF